MGFYRIIKNAVRFILYQLPKKWLIMIIFALLMVFGLTKVQAATYIDNIDTNNLTCYDRIDVGGNLVDTDICLTPGSYNNHANYQLYIEYLQSSRSYANAFSINDEEQSDDISQSSMLLQQQYQNGQWFFRIDKDWNTEDSFAMNGFVKYSLYINMFDKYVSISDGANFSHQYNFGNYTNDFFTTRTVKLNSNKDYKSGSFYIYFMELTDYLPSVDRVVTLARYYPAKYVHYLDATTSQTYIGFYNSVNNDFLVWKTGDYQYMGSVIDTPTYTPPEVDYSENLVDINNSINNVNDFLQDTNVDTTDLSIDTPAIQNSQVAGQADTSLTNLFNAYLDAFTNSGSVFSVDLYIPNMSNGQILSTITVPSNYVSSKLSAISLFFLPGKTMLDLVHIIWYVLFGFWFIYMVTDLVTLLYSGLIMQKDGIEKLTDTYTGISKNLL